MLGLSRYFKKLGMMEKEGVWLFSLVGAFLDEGMMNVSDVGNYGDG